jgi:hypothetical protein
MSHFATVSYSIKDEEHKNTPGGLIRNQSKLYLRRAGMREISLGLATQQTLVLVRKTTYVFILLCEIWKLVVEMTCFSSVQ